MATTPSSSPSSTLPLAPHPVTLVQGQNSKYTLGSINKPNFCSSLLTADLATTDHKIRILLSKLNGVYEEIEFVNKTALRRKDLGKEREEGAIRYETIQSVVENVIKICNEKKEILEKNRKNLVFVNKLLHALWDESSVRGISKRYKQAETTLESNKPVNETSTGSLLSRFIPSFPSFLSFTTASSSLSGSAASSLVSTSTSSGSCSSSSSRISSSLSPGVSSSSGTPLSGTVGVVISSEASTSISSTTSTSSSLSSTISSSTISTGSSTSSSSRPKPPAAATTSSTSSTRAPAKSSSSTSTSHSTNSRSTSPIHSSSTSPSLSSTLPVAAIPPISTLGFSEDFVNSAKNILWELVGIKENVFTSADFFNSLDPVDVKNFVSRFNEAKTKFKTQETLISETRRSMKSRIAKIENELRSTLHPTDSGMTRLTNEKNLLCGSGMAALWAQIDLRFNEIQTMLLSIETKYFSTPPSINESIAGSIKGTICTTSENLMDYVVRFKEKVAIIFKLKIGVGNERENYEIFSKEFSDLRNSVSVARILKVQEIVKNNDQIADLDNHIAIIDEGTKEMNNLKNKILDALKVRVNWIIPETTERKN